jgi:hypothetical protein
MFAGILLLEFRRFLWVLRSELLAFSFALFCRFASLKNKI